MKKNHSWHIVVTAGIAAAVSFSTLPSNNLQAQDSRPERKGLFSRLMQNRDQTPPATQVRTEIETTRTAVKPASASAPMAKPAAPIAKPAPAPTEPVARERGPGEIPQATPVATPVASRAPAAIAEPVARPVPGAAQTMQAAESTEPASASAAAAKDSPIALLANAEVPDPQDLRPKFDKEKPPAPDGAVMEITSEESVLHNEADERMVEFTGQVFLNHPAFNMSSDRLEVFLNDEGEDAAPAKEGEDKPPFKRAIATGAMVKIVRINPQGETEVAFARRADFDGVTGDVVLSGGPPELQTGKLLVETAGEDAKIFLLANGKYSVKGSTAPNSASGPTSRIVIPVKGDNATSSPKLLPTQFNEVKSDRSRE